MKYVLKENPELVVTVKEVKKDTTIESAQYGPILVTKGNFIMKSKDGSEVGITPADLELQYKPAE